MAAAGEFNELVTRWVQSQPWSRRTRENYVFDLGQLDQWCSRNGIRPLKSTAGDIVRYFSELDRSGLAPATRNRRLTALKNFFQWLVEQRIRVDDPTAEIVRSREHKQPRDVLTLDELRALLTTADRPLERALVALLGVNGLSLNEVVVANISDFRRDLTPMRLRIHHSRSVATRQAGGERVTVLPDISAAALEAAVGNRTSGPLLVSPKARTRLNQRSIQRALDRVAERAGFERRVTSAMLTNCMRVTAIESGFSFSSIARALPGSDLRGLMPRVPLEGPLHDHAALRIAALLVEDRRSDSTLLAQADRLCAQPDVDPCVGVAVAASVLERHLRNLARAHNLSPDDERKASLSVYAKILREARKIQNQDVDGVMRVLRARDAADHGWFDEVDVVRAVNTIDLVRQLLDSCPLPDEPDGSTPSD